jgi:fatty-acyl-CoA synthase
MENALMSCPSVFEAAVVGVPHPKWDERPLALVVLREENKLTSPEEICEHLTKSFAKWQIPDEILFVNSIPRTSVGKIDKKHIRKEYRDQYSK